MERIKIAGIFTGKSKSAEFFILTHNGRHIAALPEMFISFYVGDGRKAALKALTGPFSASDAEKVYNTIYRYVYPQGSKEQDFMSWFEEKYGLSWSTFDEGMKKSRATIMERKQAFNHAVSSYYKEKESAAQ
ncbi:hypothetical protein [Domibacillus epiphyticus]|uniref:Uncharacterized protein n=1 Tax=Domibacillus epiphyticus TaxID=1714355 RepID=A0A1V2AA46_9BACI|nr:hypothetical protein [Domibacillus epiphyticus]OMP67868.1 hypothetical protein BTO28_05115 [Domibacillus epiphyticus]